MTEFLNGRVRVRVGDITRERVDAVVNAANSTLLGGGGVDGAIHRAGGARVLEECQELRRTRYPEGLPAGEAVITTAGNLPARYVIHTVGPVYGLHEGREAELLAACYTNSLRLAAEHALASVAFPAISTGAFGYPREEAARVASAAIKEFLEGGSGGGRNERAPASQSVRDVRLVFFSESDARVFLENQSFQF
jgi:O-acetyl-ADP-ribose deacetylase (regulator of RNase III)